VMLGGEDQVSHSGVFGELYPLVGIELHRVGRGCRRPRPGRCRFHSGRAAGPRDQLISVPTMLTGPQWMNIPKRRSFRRARWRRGGTLIRRGRAGLGGERERRHRKRAKVRRFI
jgi:hypothetical protein